MRATLSIEQLILVDPDPGLAAAMRAAFAHHGGVSVVEGLFENLPAFDCMVSAANSFGLMDGGVDLAISRFFGWDLQDRVQARIIAEYFGEQPVGTSMIVETNHPKHPYIAHTPTMRVPMSIAGTDQVYLAMLAMLREVELFNRRGPARPIRIVACPGLGTLTGKVPAAEAARQMERAYSAMVFPITEITWQMAKARQRQVDVWPPRPTADAWRTD